jgi:prolyl-tRNA editing enzyme YbaK/EbsC (Cys-tRNA(Pro) deacylase)
MIVAGKTALTLLLYRADRKISWNKLRKLEDLKKSRMCNEEEVRKLGVLPGAVPPFTALLGVRGIVDSRFKEVKSMAFNAGLRGKSIVIATEDFPFEEMRESDITE